MSEQPQGSSFFEGLLVGSAVGAFLGMLLAPSKGDEARAKLQEKFQSLRGKCEDLKETFEKSPEDLVQKTVDAIEQGLSELANMVQEVKVAAEKRRQEVSGEPSRN